MVQFVKFALQKDVCCTFRHFSAQLGIRTTFFATDGRQLNASHDHPCGMIGATAPIRSNGRLLCFSKRYKKHHGYPPIHAIHRFRTDFSSAPGRLIAPGAV